MSMTKYRTIDIDKAISHAERLVTSQATACSLFLGFGWRSVPDAPSTFTALLEQFELSAATRRPMPVSNLYCDTTMYSEPEVNCAMRFWHDVTHVLHGADFTLDGELRTSAAQLATVEGWGFSRNSDEYRLIAADTLGQTLYSLATGNFPVDQRRFVELCLNYGMDEAIKIERTYIL